MCTTAPSTITYTTRWTSTPAIGLDWFGSHICLRCTGSGAFWKKDRNTEIISRNKTQFLECPLFFFTFCRCTVFTISIFQQAGGRRFERAWFSEDVTRVDDTEFFLCKTALVGPVCVYRAERVASKWVSELEYLGSGVAKGAQNFTQGGIFPKGRLRRALRCTTQRHTK